ncbi:MAG: hypothetical protein ACRDTG_09945 [Pseudonocardiaceae bacterium]
MTDEDRYLLGLLHDLNLACGPFGLAVVEDSLSRDDELSMAHRFVHIADRILLRACSAAVPQVIEEAEGGEEPMDGPVPPVD